jgi:hypothetical protein
MDRLAILVVHVVRSPDEEALLRLHLDRIERHTTVPYRIYAATPRVTDTARALLAARPDVEVIATPPATDRGSREHAHHLDALVPHALADGADHLATMDLDAFPVVDGWHDVLLDPAPAPGVAGILRRENGDTVLLHPSCLLLPTATLRAHPTTFSPDTDGTPEFRAFLRAHHQAADTGIRIALMLEQQRIPTRPVLRTNRVDLHPLIAGIYGDAVFHLGAGGRASLFRRDLATSRVHRWTSPVERVPVGSGRLRDVKRAALEAVRRPAERRLIAANAAAADRARRWLRQDPDALLDHLRGVRPLPDA